MCTKAASVLSYLWSKNGLNKTVEVILSQATLIVMALQL